MAWLKQQGVDLPMALIPAKIADHHRSRPDFAAMLQARLAGLKNDPGMRTAFITEMQRFLPARLVGETLVKESYWDYLVNLLGEEVRRAMAALPS